MTKELNPPKHIIFVGAFIFREGKLLLAQRSFEENHLPGYWAVPGGKVEIAPDTFGILEKTVADEVEEEVGLQISSDMKLFCNNSFTRTDGQPVIALNFLCQADAGEPEALEDTIEVKWVNESELATLTIEPATLKQIQLAFKINRAEQ